MKTPVRRKETPEQIANAWNRKHKVGTLVCYTDPKTGESITAATRSPAVIRYKEVVIWVMGNLVALDIGEVHAKEPDN